MKVNIDKNGVMSITPESEKEDMLLSKWYSKNATKACFNTILFNRFKK